LKRSKIAMMRFHRQVEEVRHPAAVSFPMKRLFGATGFE